MTLGLRLMTVQRQIPKLRQRQQLKCSVCKRPMSPERRIEDAQAILLFGHIKYAVCCCCEQIVYDADYGRGDRELFCDRGYRNRYTRWKNRRDKPQS